MKRSPEADNQIYCGHLSSAQLDHWQAPKQRPIINRHPVKQIAYRRYIKDNGYKSVFTNSWLVRQRNRSWIKGLAKNPQKSELIHWRQCLLSGATEPCPLGLRETQCNTTYGMLITHGSRPNSQKTECMLRLPVKREEKKMLRLPPICGWKIIAGVYGMSLPYIFISVILHKMP